MWLAVVGAGTCLALASAPSAAGNPPANKLYAYEANFTDARLLEYDINQETSTVTFRRSCVPNPGPFNGRGIALDERQGTDEPSPGGMNEETRILYNTTVTGTLDGDGLIRRNRLPSHGCRSLPPIPFGEGPGPPNQDDIGALDFHDVDDWSRGKGQDQDVLYAAGYLQTPPTGYPSRVGGFQILYKVNAENGSILGRCSIPTRSPVGGNDTLSFARIKVADRRTEEVLLTDLGEFRPFIEPDSLAAIDVDSLEGPPAPARAPQCRLVADFPAPAANAPECCTGVDYEEIPKPTGEVATPTSLVAASRRAFWDANQPPFNPARPMGSAQPPPVPFAIEDISVNRVNPPEEPAPR